MSDPFDMSGAFDPLKWDVIVVQSRGERVIRSTARALVVVGSGLSTAAGAQISTENADRYTVTIEHRDFDFAVAPEFGDSITTDAYGKLTVKQVTNGEHEWTIRCSRDMMGGLPS